MASQETTYYQDGQVAISNSRAVLGAKTYAMSNITSVTMGEKPANRALGGILVLVGVGGYVLEAPVVVMLRLSSAF